MEGLELGKTCLYNTLPKYKLTSNNKQGHNSNIYNNNNKINSLKESQNSIYCTQLNIKSERIGKGACKYYISTLGGSEGYAYFAYVVRGGLEAKCLYCLGKRL